MKLYFNQKMHLDNQEFDEAYLLIPRNAEEKKVRLTPTKVKTK
jgi:hypothetical protein